MHKDLPAIHWHNCDPKVRATQAPAFVYHPT